MLNCIIGVILRSCGHQCAHGRFSLCASFVTAFLWHGLWFAAFFITAVVVTVGVVTAGVATTGVVTAGQVQVRYLIQGHIINMGIRHVRRYSRPSADENIGAGQGTAVLLRQWRLTRQCALLRIAKITAALIVLFAMPAYGQQAGSYQIVETIDHDATYFTQGLEVSGDLMYESSGLYAKSKIRKYRAGSDKALLERRLADRFFAEGLTLFDDELFVLTWRENTLLVLNPDDLQTRRELSYQGEGWGLASSSTQLIMSDGSDTIYFRNPESFRVERKIRVHSQQRTVRNINELEFAEGYLWANIWQSPFIVKINPATGSVVAYYDFSELVKKHAGANRDQVLNGIAYDAKRKGYWITGKLWSKQYLVTLE